MDAVATKMRKEHKPAFEFEPFAPLCGCKTCEDATSIRYALAIPALRA